MLGKLLKHEFKATSRYFIPTFIIIAVVTALLKISMILSEDSIFMSMEISMIISIIQGLFVAIYVFVLVGTSILAIFLLLKRFYSNMFGDEGYLTHTLPASGTQLLNSKLICSFTWIMLLIPVWILSFLILFTGTDYLMVIRYYIEMFTEELSILSTSGFSVGLIGAELVIMAILGSIGMILSYYLSMTLGQHFLGNHRLLGAILFYFVLNVISSTISSIYTTLLENIFYHDAMIVTAADSFRLITVMFAIAIVISLIQCIAYYLLTRYFLTKKLNLH